MTLRISDTVLGTAAALVLVNCTVEVEDLTGPLSYSPPANLQNVEVRVRSNTPVTSVELEALGAVARPMGRVPGRADQYALAVPVNACQGVLTYQVAVDGPRIARRSFPAAGSFSHGISGRPTDCVGVPGPFSRVFVADRHNDFPDFSVGDGICAGTDIDGTQGCSLRAAVMEANALEGHDLIRVSTEKHFFNRYPAGSEGADELIDSVGDLDITDSLTIEPVSISNRTALEILAHQFMYNDVPNGETAKIDAVNSGPPWEDDPVRVFQVAVGATLVLRHVEVARGLGVPGAAILNQGTLLLDHVMVLSSSNDGDGGGIYSEGPLYVVDSLIGGNVADSGGGLYLLGPATIERSVIAGNVGRVNSAAISSAGDLTISNSAIFSNNGREGSIMSLQSGGRTDLSHVTWAHNQIGSRGGQFRGPGGGNMTVRNSLFVDNTGSWGSPIGSLGGNVSDSRISRRDLVPVLPDYFGEVIDFDPEMADLGGFLPSPRITSRAAIPRIAGRGNVPPIPFTDMRGPGYPRPRDITNARTGPADAGAFEYAGP